MDIQEKTDSESVQISEKGQNSLVLMDEGSSCKRYRGADSESLQTSEKGQSSLLLMDEGPSSKRYRGADFPYSPNDPDSYKDLVFEDKEDGRRFYADFARTRGFGVRIGSWKKKKLRNSDQLYIHYVYIVCSKAGKKAENDQPGHESRSQRAETRTNCQALLKLRMDFEKHGYVIFEWTDLHNHAMIDEDKVGLIRTFRKIQPEHKVMIDMHVKNGIDVRSTFDALKDTYGSVEDMGFTRKDLWNYVSSVKRKAMFAGDAVLMHKWLRDQASTKPGFFYDIEVDEERRIKSVCWADSVMRDDYSKFGDFVSFDTTYRTNDTARPLGMFVGFNHHKCTTIFGAALMYDETAISFKWVFETFLKCMANKHPKTIMTDQAPAIALAIRDVFPGVFHALCSWHIDQNARKRLGSRATSGFLDSLNQLFRYVDSEAEFEFVWQRMLVTCFDGRPTSDNSWLSFIYTFRKQWSSAWVKDHFTAGKITTQLSEQLNAFARFYLKPDMPVSELMGRFQHLVDDLRFNEKSRDFYMQNTVPFNNFKHSSLMCDAANMFTPRVFKIIQKEYECGMSYDMKDVKPTEDEIKYSFQETMRIFSGQCKLIQVQRWEKSDTVDRILVEEETVRLDIEQEVVKCSCRFLENSWMICRHILRVLEVYGAFGFQFCKSIPAVYKMKRWGRSAAKPCIVSVNNNENVPSTHGQRYQRMYNYTVAVGTRICYNEEAFLAYMRYCYEGAKVADEILQKCSQPTREECSSSVEGVDDCYDTFKFKKRRNIDDDGSKVRLMSSNETRHLKWKQKLRREMAAHNRSGKHQS